MGYFIDVILANRLYMIIAASIIIMMGFFVVKKMIKLFLYAFLILIVFLAYVYYTGTSVTSAIEPVEKAVKKAEQIVK